MNNTYAEEILLMLSEVLPPLTQSVNSLMIYIQNDGLGLDNKKVLNELAGLTLHTGKSHETLSPKFKKILSKGVNDLTDEEKPILSLYIDYQSGMELILKAVNKLLILMIEENDKTGEVKNKDWYKKIGPKEGEVYTIEDAIDHLYEGGKKIVSIVDKVVK
jgi:hypothetical protein